MQKDGREGNVVTTKEQLSTKVQVEVQQAIEVEAMAKSTTKGDGDGKV